MTAPERPESTPASRSHPSVDRQRDDGRQRTGCLRRAGCGLLLPLWFLLLMMPCGLFYLAVNGEIRIWQDGVPDPHRQPRLLISLISEMDNRGLRIETSSVFNPDADMLSTCVETRVRFVLWESQDSGQDVSYCECYARADESSAWTSDRTYGNSCARKE